MKILFVFLHGIGDCLMLTPALRFYKEKNPENDIVILCLKLTEGIFKNNKNVDEVFTSEYFDTPPNHGNWLKYIFQRMKIQKEINGIKEKHGYDKMEYIVPWSWRVFRINVPVPGVARRILLERFESHEVLRLCRRLNVGDDKKWPDDFYQELEIPMKNVLEGERILRKFGIKEKFCVIHADASSKNKGLSEGEKNLVINMVKKKKFDAVVLQENGNREDVKYVVTDDVLTSAAVIKRCDLFIGADSGPAHIAEALGKKMIVISKAFKTRLLYMEKENSLLMDGFDLEKIK